MNTSRYLLISDDPAVYDLVARRLQADGAEVDTTRGLENAYDLLAAERYRAVLLDLTPALVGHLLLLVSRTLENEATPFVVLLGTSEVQRHWAEEFGAEKILEKIHTNLAEVVRTLEEVSGAEATAES